MKAVALIYFFLSFSSVAMAQSLSEQNKIKIHYLFGNQDENGRTFFECNQIAWDGHVHLLAPIAISRSGQLNTTTEFLKHTARSSALDLPETTALIDSNGRCHRDESGADVYCVVNHLPCNCAQARKDVYRLFDFAEGVSTNSNMLSAMIRRLKKWQDQREEEKNAWC